MEPGAVFTLPGHRLYLADTEKRSEGQMHRARAVYITVMLQGMQERSISRIFCRLCEKGLCITVMLPGCEKGL